MSRQHVVRVTVTADINYEPGVFGSLGKAEAAASTFGAAVYELDRSNLSTCEVTYKHTSVEAAKVRGAGQ